MLDVLTLAAEAAEPMSFNIVPHITTIIVFLVAFGILAKGVWPKILKGLDEREAKILGEIQAAEQAREQAKSALAEYERNLAAAREEANAMIAKARNDAKAAGEELRARNTAMLAEEKQRATAEIEQAKQAAIAELHAHSAMLATTIASKVLKREINARDQQMLVDESLAELARARRN